MEASLTTYRRGDVIRCNLAAVMGLWQTQHNRRLTLRELAEKTGLSPNFLHRFQHGDVQKLDLDKLQSLCDFFRVTPDSLLWVEDGSSGKPAAKDTK